VVHWPPDMGPKRAHSGSHGFRHPSISVFRARARALVRGIREKEAKRDPGGPEEGPPEAGEGPGAEPRGARRAPQAGGPRPRREEGPAGREEPPAGRGPEARSPAGTEHRRKPRHHAVRKEREGQPKAHTTTAATTGEGTSTGPSVGRPPMHPTSAHPEASTADHRATRPSS